MQFKKIVGFGDSWMYGDELMDPVYLAENPNAHYSDSQNFPYRLKHCFLGLLGEHYGVPIENFGIPGGSLTSTMWTFQWWMDNETLPFDECLVLVALTNSDRITHYNPNHTHYSIDPPWNKFVHSTWVNFGSSVVPEDFATMMKYQMTLTDCPALSQLNYQHAVLFFDGVAARNNLKMHQFNIMPAERMVPNTPTLREPGVSWTMFFRDHPGNQNRELICADGHPNEIGHTIIRDHLISQIDSC
jgi:hypothetical protein